MARTTAVLIGLVIASVLVAGVGVTLIDGGPNDTASAAAPDAGPQSTITVSADGEVTAEPDKAIIRLAATARADDAATARTRVAENVSAIRAALSELGLNESQLRTVDYDLYARETERRKPAADDGSDEVTYHARHTLAIEVADIDRTGAVIDAAIDAGADRIHDVGFTLADSTRADLRQQALAGAMTNARAEATTLASAGNLSIAGVHSISTTDVHVPIVRTEYAAAASAGGDTEISSGPVSVTATVKVVFNATVGA